MKLRKRGRFIVHVILLLGLVIVVFPFIWMILTSFKTEAEAIHVPPIIFPSHLNLEGYISVFTELPFVQVYLNTFISTIVTVIGQVVLCSMAGYAFGRIDFPA